MPRLLYAAALLLWLAPSCGQKFELPSAPSEPPLGEGYNYRTTWHDILSPRDLCIWGSYTYVITNTAGPDTGTARLEVFLTHSHSAAHPPAHHVLPFSDLVNPVHVAVARRDSTFVFVADQGDTTVKQYFYLGGPPLYRFRDPAWKEFSGLAVDDDLNFYVSEASRDTISQYDRHGRFLRVLSSRGSGSGFVLSPHGMHWNGRELIVSDTGQDRIVFLRTDATEIANREPIGAGSGLHRPDRPRDVAADRGDPYSPVFVADTGNDRIFRFTLEGAFIDTVFPNENTREHFADTITEPSFLAVQGDLVLVSDPASNRVVVFQYVETTTGKGSRHVAEDDQ